MKILWFYRYAVRYNFDSWLHLDYVKYLATRSDIQIKVYGHDLEYAVPDLVVRQYDDRWLLKDLYDLYKFDVIICNTKSRMFSYYSPYKEESSGWRLPKFGAPAVLL